MAGMGWGRGRAALRAREAEADYTMKSKIAAEGLAAMLVMLGVLEAGQKIKGEEKSRWSPTGRRCSKQSPVALAFFSSGRFSNHIFWFARSRKDQWKQQQGERAGRKGNIEVPSFPLGLVPSSREQCLVLGAARSPLPHELPAAPSNLISRKVPHASESSFWGLALPSCPPWSTYRALDSYRLERPVERRWAGYSPTPQGERPDDHDLAVMEVGGSLGLVVEGKIQRTDLRGHRHVPRTERVSHRRSIGPRAKPQPFLPLACDTGLAHMEPGSSLHEGTGCGRESGEGRRAGGERGVRSLVSEGVGLMLLIRDGRMPSCNWYWHR